MKKSFCIKKSIGAFLGIVVLAFGIIGGTVSNKQGTIKNNPSEYVSNVKQDIKKNFFKIWSLTMWNLYYMLLMLF